MLNVNDWMNKPRQITTDITVSADDGVVSGACRVMSITCNTAAAVATIAVNDALTQAAGGTTITVMNGIQPTDSKTVDFGPQGVLFSTGLSTIGTGVGVTGHVTYIVE